MDLEHSAGLARSLAFSLALAAVGLLAPSASAQMQAPPSVEVDYDHDTGPVANTGAQTAVVASFLVQVPGAQWIQLRFAELRLAGEPLHGTSSVLRLTSAVDGAVQELDVIGARQWRDVSAYFNGDAVLVELVAEPGTGTNRVRVASVTSGLVPAAEESQCGSADDRVPSFDSRAARILPVGCTGWLIDDCNHCFLTAGHCASGTTTVQFNVPLSSATGAIQHPPPSDQYAVDSASMQTNGGAGTGDDWAYFGCFANSTTGLEPFVAQGAAYALQVPPPPFDGTQSIRITGYGVDSGSANQTQQTHVGPWATSTGSLIQYVTDTTGGNSGSPVIHEPSGAAIGIHTHGGCTSTGGMNSGTNTNHAGLQAALASPQGICGSPLQPAGGFPTVIAPGQPTDLAVSFSGAIVPGSAFLFHRFQGGGFVASPLVALGGGLYGGTLPPPACGDVPEFYFSVAIPGCGPVTLPPSAPASTFSALVGTTTFAFADDFETDQGWSVANSAGLTTGAWQRAVPLPGAQEDPPADADGSGSCYVTQNAGGNFDVDNGTTSLVSPPFDLSAGGLVRYSYWLGSTGTIGAGDGLTVEVATDAGGTNWQLLRSYTSPSTTWRADSIDVGTEVGASSTLRVRFACSDVGTGHIVEGGVDGFEAFQIACGATGTTFCAGDGSATGCPCANGGSAGQGCENSSGTGGAALTASGSASVSNDGIQLLAGALPNVTTVSFLPGDQPANGGAGILFGDGLRCVAGTLVRLAVRPVSGGSIAFGAGVGGDPAVSAQGAVPGGATRWYQAHYRDPFAFCTAATFNTSNGLDIVWAP